MASAELSDQEAARQCGYMDELSSAPSTSAPKRFLTPELFPHYEDGRRIGLNRKIDEREAETRAAEQVQP